MVARVGQSSGGSADATSEDLTLGRPPGEDSLEAGRAMAAVAAKLFASVDPDDEEALTLGRFQLRERVGQGGMGLVYAAWDPDLARRVAIKVVRPDAARDESGSTLLSEARTLARLQHPNVVTLLDAGRTGRRVWIAMEFVPTSVDRWLKTGPEPTAIVDVFRQAAHGLLAAHRTGLVHRDFKPGNVLLRDDGSAAVADFGLARRVTEGAAAGRAGTPFYMSPEQFDGGAVDARSDQYSWCVALYHALHGEHPYLGESLQDRRTATRQGRLRRSGEALPARIDSVLARGLAEDPNDRFDDMEALLAAFDRRDRRRRGVIVGLVSVAAVGGVGILLPTSAVDPCEAVASTLSDVWNETQRGRLEQRFETVAPVLATDASQAVVTALDRYGAEWTEARVGACREALGPDHPGDDLVDRRIACLDSRRVYFETTVEDLLVADAETVPHAVDVADSLPSLSRCDDDEALRASVPRPEDPERAAELDALYARLARTDAQFVMGRYAESVDLAREARRRADAVGYAPYSVWARRLEGRGLTSMGQFEEGSRLLEEAGLMAQAVGDDESILLAATALVRHQAELAPYAKAIGVDWERLGAAVLERLDSPPDHALRWWQALVMSRAKRHDLEGALEAVEKAQAFVEAGSRPGSNRRAVLMSTHGAVLFELGRFDEALDLLQRAKALHAESIGTSHPGYAGVVQNIGSLHTARGEPLEGRRYFLEALKVMEALLGEDSTQLADLHYNLGVVDVDLGELDAAEAAFETAREMYERERGPDHPWVAAALEELARVELKRDRPERARKYLVDAKRIKEGVLGAKHAELLPTLSMLGRVALATGQPEEGLAMYEQMYELTRETYGADSDRTGTAAVRVSTAALATGDAVRAKQEAERAVAVFEALPNIEPDWLADAHYALARAVAERDPERARRLAEQARDAYASASSRADVEIWLASLAQ